jgi:peptidoglycan hydrolase-like protein with peptidoglycan-binding domain
MPGRILEVGSEGEDVRILQKFLNTHGYVISASGPGSLGNETTSFGPATKAALIKFQEKYAAEILIPNGFSKGTGMYGPATQKKVAEIESLE